MKLAILSIITTFFLLNNNDMKVPVIKLNQNELEVIGFTKEKEFLKLHSNVNDVESVFEVYKDSLAIKLSFKERKENDRAAKIVLVTETSYKLHFNAEVLNEKTNYLPVLVSFDGNNNCKQFIFFFEENKFLKEYLLKIDKYKFVSIETIKSIIEKQ